MEVSCKLSLGHLDLANSILQLVFCMDSEWSLGLMGPFKYLPVAVAWYLAARGGNLFYPCKFTLSES